MSKLVSAVFVVACLGLVLASCSKEADSKKGGSALPKSDLPEAYLLKAEPAGAKSAGEIRANAKTGDKVVVSGVVGGRKSPFIDGVAAFTIVDESIKNKCKADECETPWDYCCTAPDELTRNMITIEFREKDVPLKTSARGFHGLDHQTTVVVAGEAKRDQGGNVVVAASGIYVKP